MNNKPLNTIALKSLLIADMSFPKLSIDVFNELYDALEERLSERDFTAFNSYLYLEVF